MHYYQFNIADYRKDTVHLTPIEHYIYRQLIDWYYLDECEIPKKTKLVMRRLGLVSEFLENLENILSEFFEETETGYKHGRIEREIEIYKTKAETARANGSKGGRPKGSKNKPKKTQQVKNRNPEKTGSKPNQEPITNNNKKQEKEKIPFVDFWSAYPKGDRKSDAEKKWKSLNLDDQKLALSDCQTRYQETEKQFIPAAVVYLNGKRWQDDPVTPSTKFGGGQFEPPRKTIGAFPQ